ncbi:MAG: hypothetical protein HRT90_11510 [Candidatus Margulisbacteria bacterium]|nr:hypothetical protein [Candidatus Margulisiibacteriota bacterium]
MKFTKFKIIAAINAIVISDCNLELDKRLAEDIMAKGRKAGSRFLEYVSRGLFINLKEFISSQTLQDSTFDVKWHKLDDKFSNKTELVVVQYGDRVFSYGYSFGFSKFNDQSYYSGKKIVLYLMEGSAENNPEYVYFNGIVNINISQEADQSAYSKFPVTLFNPKLAICETAYGQDKQWDLLDNKLKSFSMITGVIICCMDINEPAGCNTLMSRRKERSGTIEYVLSNHTYKGKIALVHGIPVPTGEGKLYYTGSLICEGNFECAFFVEVEDDLYTGACRVKYDGKMVQLGKKIE